MRETPSHSEIVPWVLIEYMIYLLTAIGLTLGGSNTAHIYTQIHRQHNETEYPERNIHNNKNT